MTKTYHTKFHQVTLIFFQPTTLTHNNNRCKLISENQEISNKNGITWYTYMYNIKLTQFVKIHSTKNNIHSLA